MNLIRVIAMLTCFAFTFLFAVGCVLTKPYVPTTPALTIEEVHKLIPGMKFSGNFGMKHKELIFEKVDETSGIVHGYYPEKNGSATGKYKLLSNGFHIKFNSGFWQEDEIFITVYVDGSSFVGIRNTGEVGLNGKISR